MSKTKNNKKKKTTPKIKVYATVPPLNPHAYAERAKAALAQAALARKKNRPFCVSTPSSKKYSEGELIDILRDIVEANPEQVITRNFFRNNSGISEADWVPIFGDFDEFKRQASIIPSRQQQRHERHIAKHMAHRHYGAFNIERANYENKYTRDRNNSAIKTVLVLSDLHDADCCPFYLRTVISVAKDMYENGDLDVICLNGDIFDNYDFSRFTVDPSDFNPDGRVAFVHNDILRPLREACPDVQIDLIEGNHEARLIRHLADTTPATACMLQNFHGMNVAQFLKLDEYEINYIGRMDLTAFSKSDIKKELGKNTKVYYGTCFASHYPDGAKNGMPGWNGHHHKHVCTPYRSPIYGPYEWHQLGCGQSRRASYCDASQWTNGFLVARIMPERHRVNFSYYDTTPGFVEVCGKFYTREEHEFLRDD